MRKKKNAKPEMTTLHKRKEKLTHFDPSGKARMVDVSIKDITLRKAVAVGRITMSKAALDLVKKGSAKKGDVLGVARLAGIMAAKKTAALIPLCHTLPLDAASVDFQIGPGTIDITATCVTRAQTGVEMEALTAISVAALTIYDMVKAVDKNMHIGNIRLHHKSGGRSGTFDAGS